MKEFDFIYSVLKRRGVLDKDNKIIPILYRKLVTEIYIHSFCQKYGMLSGSPFPVDKLEINQTVKREETKTPEPIVNEVVKESDKVVEENIVEEVVEEKPQEAEETTETEDVSEDLTPTEKYVEETTDTQLEPVVETEKPKKKTTKKTSKKSSK